MVKKGPTTSKVSPKRNAPPIGNKRKISSNDNATTLPSKKTPTEPVGNFITSNSWLDTPIINGPTKPKKNLKQEEVNPVFSKFATMTSDPFWKDVFKDAAKGKFKKGFSFKNDVLNFKKVNKVFTVLVDEATPEKMEEIMKFMQNYNKNMISNEDIKKIQDKIQEKPLTTKPLTWKTVKDKPTGEILMYDYLKEVSKQNGLNTEEFNNLQTIVGLALILKNIDDDEVVMENDKITDIKCLCKDNGLFKIDDKNSVLKNRSMSKKSTGRKTSKKTSSSLELEECLDKQCYMHHFNNFLNNLETETCRRIHSTKVSKGKGVSFKPNKELTIADLEDN
jgi:hypothetical protein